MGVDRTDGGPAGHFWASSPGPQVAGDAVGTGARRDMSWGGRRGRCPVVHAVRTNAHPKCVCEAPGAAGQEVAPVVGSVPF